MEKDRAQFSSTDSGYKQRLEQQAEALGVRSHLTFLGYVENPKSLIAAADLFLMCSKSEAFGRVTVEAMSVGCPIVGSHSGGTKEIVEEGVSGVLYNPGDPEDLAKKISDLLPNRALRKRLSSGGRKRAQEFEVERSVDCVMAALRKYARLRVD